MHLGINKIDLCARTNSTLPEICLIELLAYTGIDK